MATQTKEIKKPAVLPAPNSDFYELVETLAGGGVGGSETGARLHGDEGCAHHHEVLGRRCFSVRNSAGDEGTQHRRRRHEGLWLQGRKCAAIRLDSHGDGALRFVDRDILRCAQRPGDGFDLPGRIGRTKTEVAPADGSLGKDRLLRLDRTACRVRSLRRAVRRQRSGKATPGSSTVRRSGSATLRGATSRSSGHAIVADNQVKAFIVENKTTPGFKVEKIQNKIALKVVQNGLITMENCRVPEENRLQADQSFRDTARVLKMTRFMVGWEATGCAMGAYENALKYCQERLQFGKPIGSFQMVQDLLARMLGNITASQCLVVRMAQLQAEGKLTDAHAALAKAFTTAKCRETVAWARELLRRQRHRRRLQRWPFLRGCGSALLL